MEHVIGVWEYLVTVTGVAALEKKKPSQRIKMQTNCRSSLSDTEIARRHHNALELIQVHASS